METQIYTDTLVVIVCGGCGVRYGLDRQYYEDRQRDGKGFNCPNGCSRVFRETTEQKLRKSLERAEGDSAYWRDRMREEQQAAQHARNQARAEKAAKTRLKNRVAAGVCPCCKRHFTNLERHIAGQHPDYAPRSKASVDGPGDNG